MSTAVHDLSSINSTVLTLYNQQLLLFLSNELHIDYFERLVQYLIMIEANNFSFPYIQTIIMIKKLISLPTPSFLFKTIFSTFAYSQPQQHKQPQPQKKAYEILLQNSIDNLLKSPSHGVLKSLRSRGIARIMAANHNLFDMPEVLEVHVECLNALVYRIEPSIDAIAMFTEKVYNELEHLRGSDISAPALLNLLKPSIITKIVRIAQSIDPFYNETFRGMISVLVVKLMEKSVKNEAAYASAMKTLAEEFQLLKKGAKQVDSQGNLVSLQNLGSWHWKKTQQLVEKYRHATQLDYWNGFQFILSMQYYTDSFLLTNLSRLQRSLQKDIRNYTLNELIIKIKCIVELHKFKNSKLVGEKGLRTLLFSYNKMVQQYFKMLSAETTIFELMNSDEAIIQTQLLTSFLTPEHHQRAKKTYLDVFKVALNISNNGTLLMDVKRLRGIFQIILILYTHQDTKQVHSILTQLQKVMNIYPLDKFQKLQTHCYVCQKFGYRSDFLAGKFYTHLLMQKKKLQRNRGHLHRVHQVAREIQLARKFMICLKIMARPSKEFIEEVSKIINGLFDPNVWFCINQTDTGFQTFLTASAFSHHIYFQRVGLKNITLGGYQRRKIEGIILQTGLKNLNKQYSQVCEDLRGYAGNKSNSKLDHTSGWRLNPHARMKTVLQLGNFNYEYLKRTNQQDANNFIQLFLAKTLGSSVFYNSLKQRFAYPGIMEQYIQLMEKSNVKNYQIQVRDLEAIKRMYQAQLQRILKPSERPSFSILYQDHLDFIQLNRAVIPTNSETFGLSNISNCASVSLLHQAMKRFQKQKQYVKMQIQTFMKFNKTGQIIVTTNYMEFPYLGDIRVTYKEENMMLLFRHYESDAVNFINYKQLDLQREAEAYWKKKGYQVYIMKSQKDVEDFMKKVTKMTAVKG